MTDGVERYVGLMSGTSLDGVDGVLVAFAGGDLRVEAHAFTPFAPGLRAELLALNTSGHDELHRAALAGNALARVYTDVVHALLEREGRSASAIVAIGAHGQTVRHRPGAFDGTGYTLQLNNPALLAELSGIDVVADFRSRDVAAGGQGAPLVPAFHREVFGRAHATVCVLNVGGISNLSVLSPNGGVTGFDCGPGNALMDHWCQLHTGELFDHAGAWAAGGQVVAPLIESILSEPYLTTAPPKSTGRDLFNAPWLARHLAGFPDVAPRNVQATLLEFTARVCADDVRHHAPDCEALLVCGGGALNTALMQRLQSTLPNVTVSSTAFHGLPPMQVEATAFAWLARKAVHREPASLESVTGTRGARVLGALYPR